MFFIFFIVKRTLLEKRNHNYRKGICEKERLRLLILWKTEKGFFYISYCTTIFAYRLCIYTMLSHIVRKNKLFRALCMMMLLLIHLDAYAYEVISACQVDTQDEMAIPSAADTFQEEDVNVLEWEDLSYSKTSVRSFFWWFVLGSLPLFFICFRNIIADISVIVRTVSLRVFPVRPYVTFCTLLI